MWLAIKNLYTDVKVQVMCSGSLSRSFDISHGAVQGRILAPFMYSWGGQVHVKTVLHVCHSS